MLIFLGYQIMIAMVTKGIMSEDRVLGPPLEQDDKLVPTKFESACDFY